MSVNHGGPNRTNRPILLSDRDFSTWTLTASGPVVPARIASLSELDPSGRIISIVGVLPAAAADVLAQSPTFACEPGVRLRIRHNIRNTTYPANGADLSLRRASDNTQIAGFGPGAPPFDDYQEFTVVPDVDRVFLRYRNASAGGNIDLIIREVIVDRIL